MSPRGVPVTEAEQAQNELLAQLGLAASASPDDVDRLHEAASEYLASAPPQLRGWAHAQVAALDAAYLKLTDPVGLEGSALRSPTSPSVVVPGGPATPPARRDLPRRGDPGCRGGCRCSGRRRPRLTSVAEPADEAESPEDVAAAIEGEPDAEDLAALYASVTPSAHADMAPNAKRPTKKDRREARKVASRHQGGAGRRLLRPPRTPGSGSTSPRSPSSASWWSGSWASTSCSAARPPQRRSPRATPVRRTAQAERPDGRRGEDHRADDQAPGEPRGRGDAASPSRTSTTRSSEYETAGTWLDKVIAIEPDNERAVLARGAVYFNVGDVENAEKVWTAFADEVP